jgi:long-chain acyl-CoA synthetase
MRTTVVSYLDEFISRGSDIAFAHRRELRVVRWSYEQTALSAYQFARELESRGISKGDRVLLCAENSPEWVATFFGCLLRGVILVPLDLQSDLSFVAKVQQQINAKLVVCNAETHSRFDLHLPTLLINEIPATISRHSRAPYSAATIDPNDIVEIVFTSGTTAEPKGIPLTHRNLLANLAPLESEIKRYLKWERVVHPIRFLNLVPLSHVFGQFMGLLVPQLLGGEVFFQDSQNASHIIETVKRERISVLVVVPRLLESLREKIERTYDAHHQLSQFKKDLEAVEGSHFLLRWWKFRRAHRSFGWKFWAIVSGGATLNSEMEDFWRRLGFALIQGYGMTETAALISVNHPFRAARGSIGRALPGQEMSLAEDGEILVRGQNISSGYWRHEPDNVGRDEWFKTGDIGERDQQGNIYFKGRKKDVIVTAAGVNIYPDDIEAVLNRQPETKASAVIQVDGPHGPEPLAVLILRNAHAGPQEIIARANNSLAEHQRLRRWFIWQGEDFPRTSTQKIRKQIVAETARAGQAGSLPSSEASANGSVAEIVRTIIQEPIAKVDSSAKLGLDLKLDSLARVELLSALEDRYQVEIDEASFTDATTVAEVEKMVREARPNQAALYPYPRWQHKWPISWFRIALLYGIVFTAIRLLGWPKVTGTERLAKLHAPLLFVSNHVTIMDHALILFALPARLKTKMVIAQDGELLREWRHPPKGANIFRRWLNRLEYFLVVLFFNVFSLPQKSGFRDSFRFAGEMMDCGHNVMLFPEGERTKHGRINPFRLGVGLLVKQLQTPIVPVRIHGLWKLKQAGRHFAWPGQISVNIGEPVVYANRETAEDIASDVERRVRSL